MAAERSFATIVDRLSPRHGVTVGSAFHSPGLKVDGKIFAMLVRSELVVKLPAERCRALEGSGAGRPFEIGSRTMHQWSVIDTEHDDQWLGLAEEALGYVGAAGRIQA